MKPIAIFDIDGTIFRSSLLIELVKKLVKTGVFSAKIIKKMWTSELKWQNRQGHYDDYIADVIEAYSRGIVGKFKSDIISASKLVVAEQRYRTYRFTSKLLERIRRKYFTIAISGSPLEVVLEYNKVLKFDKCYGTELGINEQGRYTEKVLHTPSLYKKEIIVRYLKNHGLSLKGSVGVGDTESDVGFLELVERPICFNPNSLLARVARKNNWQVVVERKDLVLEMSLKKVKILAP